MATTEALGEKTEECKRGHRDGIFIKRKPSVQARDRIPTSTFR